MQARCLLIVMSRSASWTVVELSELFWKFCLEAAGTFRSPARIARFTGFELALFGRLAVADVISVHIHIFLFVNFGLHEGGVHRTPATRRLAAVYRPGFSESKLCEHVNPIRARGGQAVIGGQLLMFAK